MATSQQQRASAVTLAAEPKAEATAFHLPSDTSFVHKQSSLVTGDETMLSERHISATRRLLLATPPEERAALVAEFRQLASLAGSNELTRSQRCRFALVRWELDRLRDAELGPTLDAWERIAAAQERLAGDIDRLIDNANEAAVRNARSTEPKKRLRKDG